MSLYKTMTKCNNFFAISCEKGNFTIDGQKIQVNKNYVSGQYIRIIGSILNDGVYKITLANNGYITLNENINDESFNGYIVGLAVPQDFIDLSNKIDEFDKNKKVGVASESIPNYSVSFDTSVKSGFDYYKKDLASYNKPLGNKFEFMKWLDK